jgi:hypothetical protein
MTDRPDFERSLETRLRAHADRASRPFDAVALTAAAVGGRRRSGVAWWRRATDTRGSTLRLGFVALLLATAATAGAILVGAALHGPAPIPDPLVVVPPPTSSPTATPTPPPVAVIEPSPDVTPVPTPMPVLPVQPGPALTAAGVGVGPCVSMVRLLERWGMTDTGDPLVPSPAPTHDDGYIVMVAQEGSLKVFDGSTGAPADPITDADGAIPGIAGYEGLPIAQGGEFVPTRDGRTIAVEEGDLGSAGCGDPFIRIAGEGILRPFPVRAYQTVSDLAWAPDGSALYAILRPTIDVAGQPLVLRPEDVEGFPGTVLRWDATTRAVTDLGTPCPTCRLNDLTVSPDGARVVVNTADAGAAVREPDGSWRTIGEVPKIIGWTPGGLMVVDGYDHIDTVDLDGKVVTTSGRICCHGNGYGGLLSPDGTLVVGSTLSSDFRARDIVIVDVRDGSQRMVAKMPSKDPNFPCPCQPETATKVPRGDIVAWAPDGRSLLLIDQGRDPSAATMWSLPLDTLVASKPIDVPWNQPPMVAWLPKLP